NDYEGYRSWGPVSATFLYVVPEGGTPTPVGTGTPSEPTGTPTGTPTRAVMTPTRTPVCEIGFSDVYPGDYFYEAVRFLGCAGVISGYSDGAFRAYNPTTRGQLMKMIALAERWPIDVSGGPHFRDVLTEHVFYPYVETALHRGNISGYGDGTFRPGDAVTRGQLCKVVVLAQAWPIYTPPAPT